MARHLVPASTEHFNELLRRITHSGQLGHVSAFDKQAFIRHRTSSGEIPYMHAYRSNPYELSRLPMYAMVDGIHHPKWINNKAGVSRNLGLGLFNILLRNFDRRIGSKACLVNDQLQQCIRNRERVHRGIMAMPFIFNPAACSLRGDDLSQFVDEAIDNIAQLPENMYTLREKTEYKGTYNEVHAHLGHITRGGVFTNYKFKAGAISVCYGSIVDFERKKVLAMLTLNPEYLEYYLLHKYSQSTKKLHPQIFNVVIDEEFNKNDGSIYAKELGTLVRKGMCQALPKGIEVQNIDGGEFFNELYHTEISKASAPLGPLEQIEQNAEMQENFIQSTATTKLLRKRNIVLIE